MVLPILIYTTGPWYSTGCMASVLPLLYMYLGIIFGTFLPKVHNYDYHPVVARHNAAQV